ncbi:unnamed protein product [Pieris macdunnoughi]|uniref:Peptidase S1 domain-containing protein n=1 Tax=Pieris macdunnoughi TaxID=345717 RepID=A0A821KZ50_9NEOP|nr:unnamed protein product [Pieris macdunnoughi]
MQEAIVLYLCIPLSTISGSAQRRIYGGRDAVPGEFPYVTVWGSFDREWNFELTCSSSAVSPTWILTAAHCMIPKPEKKGIVAYGDIIPGQKFNFSRVLKMFPHPGYKGGNTLNECYDIGLLRTRKIIIPQYGLLSAVDHTTIMGHEVIVAGFGFTNGTEGFTDAISANKTLQVFKGMISSCLEVDYRLCSRLCVSSTCGHVSLICGGDSGGPVIHASGIVGVNGYHNIDYDDKIHKHSLAEGSTVLQAVSPVIDWLSTTINGKS